MMQYILLWIIIMSTEKVIGWNRLTIDNQTWPVCYEATCQYRCGEAGSRDGYCRCDQLCLKFSDCCHDFASYCHRNASVRSPSLDLTDEEELARLLLWSEASSLSRSGRAHCRQHSENPQLSATTIMMVDECLKSANNHLDLTDEDIALCEDNTDPDFTSVAPVLYDDIVYRNMYCLKCNIRNVAAVRENIVRAEPNFQCPDDVQVEVFHRMRTATSKELARYMMNNCQFYASLQPLYDASPSTQHLKHCYPISTCDNSNFTGSQNEFNAARSACESYQSAITYGYGYTESNKVFRNPHCAICNGFNQSSVFKCQQKPRGSRGPVIDGPGWSNLPSFSLLLDFDGLSKDAFRFNGIKLCPDGHFIDIANGGCASGPCEQGEVLIDSKCSSINVSYELPEFELENDNIQTLLQYTGDLTAEQQMIITVRLYDEIVDDIDRIYSIFSAVRLVADCKAEVSWAVHDDITSGPCLLIDSKDYGKTRTRLPSEKTNLESRLNRIVSLLSDDTNILAANASIVAYMTTFNIFSESPVLCDADYNSTLRFIGNISFLTSGESPDKIATSEASHVLVTSDQIIEYDLVPLVYYIEAVPFPEKVVHSENFALMCVPPIIDCEKIYLDLSQMYLKGDSLVLRETEEVVSNGYFAQASQESFVICKESVPLITRGDQKQSTQEVTSGTKAQSILTVLGNTISAVFLMVTICTYALFKSLRTQPGLCIMNLSIALLSAQVTFQLSSLFSAWSTVCTVVAATQHYMWLASFMWMNSLACITYTIFAKAKSASSDYSTFGFRGLFFYSWGTPAFLISIFIAVERLELMRFQYGGRNHCWIVGDQGLTFFFALPIGLILGLNLVLFSLTLIALKKTMDITKNVSSVEHRTRLAIYVKLSSVMGFTWLFGFLANISALDVFWYFFIILNTLQGVFICISFVMNRRVLHLYLGRFRGSGSRSEKLAWTRRMTLSSISGSSSSSSASTPPSPRKQ